jgi:hypothetical protein
MATAGEEGPARLGRGLPTGGEGAGRDETRGAASTPEAAERGLDETRSTREGEATGAGEPPEGEREAGRDGAMDGTGRVGDGAADGTGSTGDERREIATSGKKAGIGAGTAEEVVAC